MTDEPATSSAVPLPPLRLRLHRDSDEDFRRLADHLAQVLYQHGLRDDSALLDVGCGVGRLAIGLLDATPFHGRYVGFDVSGKHVRWAQRQLVPLAPSFRFDVVDVRNDRYNPAGTVAPEDVHFPVRSANFDMACLFSVFTHFDPADTAVYLRELHRVLRPGGRAVATWFLWEEARRHAVEHSAFPMVHEREDGVLYADDKDPLWAIAHHLDRVHAMIAEAGLEVERVELGTWAGGPGPEGQDLVVMRKPVPPAPSVVRRLSGSVSRLLRRTSGA